MKFSMYMAILSICTFVHGQASDFFEANDHLITGTFEDRVYVKKENITIDEGGFGIFDAFGSGFVSNNLFVDNQGIYTKLSSITDKTVWNIVYCHTCKTWRTIDINGKCNTCGNNPAEEGD